MVGLVFSFVATTLFRRRRSRADIRIELKKDDFATLRGVGRPG